MALFVWTTPRPDIHASFQAWEASWDHDFKRNYEPPDRLPESGSLSRLIRSSSISLLNSDHSVMFTEQVATNLMGTQVKLSVMAAQVWESFEVDWKRASDARRRACIEKGVYCSALSAPPSQAETERKWCPETSVNHLASDGGQGYLNLVMTLTLPGHVIHAGHIAPILPSHPAIDRVSNLSTYERNTPGFKAALRIWTLWRAYHLTRVVTDIFLVFVTKPVSMDSLNSSMRTALRHITASLSPDAAKKLVIAFKQTHPEAAGPRKGPSGTPCHTCGTASTGAQQGGAKLRTCSACRKVNRFVYYCSSECQRQDWKHGKPYPHKTICGKLRSEQEIEELSNTKGFYSAEELMPKAEPSFRRSTALNRQISCLAADIRLDYVVRDMPYVLTHQT
ncbi:uncharacterized protein PHACADRAFT_154854 [Phanerochaete carnosa HHB-10118-sp]|uniref:MYND-type domain-containing protein n=1 Tax=Phanerochaete carnosa (strain HHB-10118-sp) TaxID=650164 RepID=K5WFG2_PHACS|nr:uncharacterized protein PHACADRAFT_154854 [Phanerochaete carnosa HHB-10118-sp]EKM48912.1 hypothetical protein PHACADRAFT_154854 [Phanerochaete carnosa HHB-10118-sp]